jgi:Lsr2
MAQKYLVQLVDDLTQEPIDDGAGESVSFGLDGVSYAIDLSTENASSLRDVLAPYAAAARKSEGGAKPKSSTAKSSPKEDLKAVRDWANANGYMVSSRGRIPADVQAAYRAAV